jgi:hypothetical protein
MPNPKIEGRLRIAGVLVALGLITQFLTIFWNHPLAFVVFVTVGAPLAIAGIAIYLIALLIASRGASSS